MLPVLQILRGGEHHRRALAEAMADHFSLSAAEREALLPSGKMPVIRSRTGWALSYMKQAGLVRSPRRGWYEITPLGLETLAAAPHRIDNDYLMRFEGFREFRGRSRPAAEAGGPLKPEPKDEGEVSPIPPDEALEEAYGRLRTAIESEFARAGYGRSTV